MDVIPLLPLVGLNNCQPILHMSKIMIYIYSKDEKINQFAIVYTIKPSLPINKIFR